MDKGIEVEYINALTRDGVAVVVEGRGGNGEGLRLLDDALLLSCLEVLADSAGAGVKKRLKYESSWENEDIVKKRWEEKSGSGVRDYIIKGCKV